MGYEQGVRKEENKKMSKAGRKSKLTKTLINNATSLVKKGYYNKTVCDFLKIDERSWYLWYNKGQELSELDEDELQDLTEHELNQLLFFQSLKSAHAEAEMVAVDKIQKASMKTWQAAAWYLERKYRERWGRVNKDDEDHSQGKNQLEEFLKGMESIVNDGDE